jgi:hypothetical protein
MRFRGRPGRTKPCNTICEQGSVRCCEVATLKSKDNNVQQETRVQGRYYTMHTAAEACVLQRNCEVVERVQNGESHSLQRRLDDGPLEKHTLHTQPMMSHAAVQVQEPNAYRQAQAK